MFFLHGDWGSIRVPTFAREWAEGSGFLWHRHSCRCLSNDLANSVGVKGQKNLVFVAPALLPVLKRWREWTEKKPPLRMAQSKNSIFKN
jgi:hypothetical protein